ncbi:MAG: nitroreductase family protein [Planctomycetes bacterium]|nr:nitroreductase family protein [Planctomycetota bacterium]
MPAPDTLPAMSIADIIRSRRTHKKFKPDVLKHSDIESLIELASWAPNHRLAEPWRCYAMDIPGIQKLGNFFDRHPKIASWPESGKEHKLKKLRNVYLPQLSAIIHVTSQKSSSELKDQENFAACAAAVQNILLAATERDLATFWNSSAGMRHPLTQEWLGVDCNTERFVASIWIGGKVTETTAPNRHSPSHFTRWIS